MLVCFGKNICRALTDNHLANIPRDFILLGVSTAFSLRAVMFEPILQSRWSAGAARGLPPRVTRGRCVRRRLKSKNRFVGRELSTVGAKLLGSEEGGCAGGLLAAARCSGSW